MIVPGGLFAAGIMVIISGFAYNAAVDKYGDWRIKQMQKVPLVVVSTDDDHHGMVVTKSVDQLRRTVSKRTGLVENLDDRRSWNAWLTTNSISSAGEGSTWKGQQGLLVPGTTYTFMYRSYVNFEEAGSIKKSLFHVKTWLGYVASKRGTLTVHPDGKHVSTTERLTKRLITPVTINWNGTLKQNGRRIVWTDTEMIVGSTRTVNPAGAERLRKVPWDVVKAEDGMIALKRGDVGMLVYDSKMVS